jgi:hypothetical protein
VGSDLIERADRSHTIATMLTVKKLLEDPGALRKWLAEDMESEFQAMPDPEAMLMGGPKFAAAWMGISDKCVRTFCLD